MPKSKVAITLDPAVLEQVGELVGQRRYSSRSQAIEAALIEKLERMAGTRLEREAAKLDPHEEKGLAEEGVGEELDSLRIRHQADS